ncbi:MAG: MFS transporter [Promethearchaeota archaeon]
MNVETDSVNARGSRVGTLSNLAVYLTIFIDITGFGLIIPLTPFYVKSFNYGPFAIGILIGSFALMQFIFSPLLGRISDRVGRRPVLLLSVFVSFISFLIFSFAVSYVMLLTSRIISGMATEYSMAQAYIADTTSLKERGAKYGRLGSMFGAGFIVGPAIGGFLYQYGDSTIGNGFLVAGLGATLLTLVNLLFVFAFLPETLKRPNPDGRDVSFSERNRLTGILKDPKSQVKSYLSDFFVALKKPLIGSVLFIFFIDSLAFSAIPVVVPLLGEAFFTISPRDLGIVFTYLGVISIVWQGLVIGRLVNRLGDGVLLIIGPSLMMLGLFLMPLIQDLAFFVATITMISIGNGTNNTIVPTFISRRSSPTEQGKMLGIAQSWSAIGRVPGPLIAGALFGLSIVTPFLLGSVLLLFASGLAIYACRRDKCISKEQLLAFPTDSTDVK